jgi:acyl-CoA thioesterase I
VLLIGTPEPGLALDAARASMPKSRGSTGCPTKGRVIGEVLRDNRLKSDPIHPNAAGYRLIAERVAALLQKSGAI